MSKINIIQHGVDGIGHQLHGILSCLALHSVKNYYFDGRIFINKPFKFEHINNDESLNCKKYLIEIGKKFIEYYKQKIKKYKKYIHSHEVYNIPENYDQDTIYSLDNCYYFDRIPLNDNEFNQYLTNIHIIKDFFINDKLPKNRLNTNNIVIHLRQGDAMTTGRGNSIINHNKKLVNIMPSIIDKYKDHTIYIHTDGNAKFITDILLNKNVDFKIFEKKEPILNVLSDFIHSKMLITGNSGLSIMSTFLGNHECVIIPDDIKHSVPNDVIRISNYKI